MHVSVLLQEAIDLLALKPGDTYFDGTLGGGGHSEEVWKRFGKAVTIAGCDADPLAVLTARTRLETLGAKPKFEVLNFRKIDEAPALLDIQKPDAILFDLGWNKLQFDTPEGGPGRGFSFQRDEPLVMTFGDASMSDFTAAKIVNEWDAENIETILDAYGEEKFARRIAEKIVEVRGQKEIKTSKELADIVYYAVPMWYRFKRLHPATRTFQALRIAVNDELRALQEGLRGAFQILKDGGRIAVISFHSLEDRIVKHYFRQLADGESLKLLNKRPIIPTEEEISQNPRSRSAKLRVIEKI